MAGAGLEPPTFDPNRFVLNELHVVGSFIYDHNGFERALDLLASAQFPSDLLIEADDVPLDRLSETLVGLADGHYAGKVMAVPQLSPGVVATPGSSRGGDGPSLLTDGQPAVQSRGHEPARRPARREEPR